MPDDWQKLMSHTAQSSSASISISTFNTLRKGYTYFSGCVSAEHRSWEDHRKPLLHRLIASLNTDIVCLQEAELGQFYLPSALLCCRIFCRRLHSYFEISRL